MNDVRGALYLGVDLGGTKIALSLWQEADASGRAGGPAVRLASRRWATSSQGPDANLRRIIDEAQGILRDTGLSGSGSLASVGVSAGGPLDPRAGVILSVPNLPGWENVPVAAVLSEAFGVRVTVENDANACAVAEWLYGAGKGASSLAFLTCSTGIGAGLVLDGRLYRGSRFLAGEVGHQVIVPGGLACGCGRRGCLEAYASGAGMARRLGALRSERPDAPATARELVERAKGGDAFSVGFLRETAEYLAMGLAGLVFLLNPERIVLGTIPVAAGELFFEPLREALFRSVWPGLLEGLDVLPAALGPELGDRSALAVARDIPALA